MSAPLFEAYRPKTWADVVGQDKIVKTIDVLRRRGLGGRAFWIQGGSGTGKTTIARLLAGELADAMNVTELDATQLTPARLRDVESGTYMYAVGVKPGRAIIVNEAHAIGKIAIQQLLVTLERIPSHVVWIFTTTTDGTDALFEECADASPLLSRCLRLDLSRRGLAEAFAARAREIAVTEGLDGQEMGAYIRLAKEQRNNFRAMLQAIEAGAMIGGAS